MWNVSNGNGNGCGKFMGVTQEVVWGLMPFIVGFNLIKAGINGLVTFFLYKRISEFLHE